MTDNLKTREIVDAAISLINAAVVSGLIEFTPQIVQEGALEHWVENKSDLTADLPAIFVRATGVDVDVGGRQHLSDIGAFNVGTITSLRVLLADVWAPGDAEGLHDKRQNRCEQIAQTFIASDRLGITAGPTGGQLVAGPPSYTLHRSFPITLEFEPPESEVLSMDGSRRIYAAAVNLVVEGISQPRQ